MVVFVDAPIPDYQIAAVPPAATTGDNCAERKLKPTRRARKLRHSTVPLPLVIDVTGRSGTRTETATRTTVLAP